MEMKILRVFIYLMVTAILTLKLIHFWTAEANHMRLAGNHVVNPS